MRMNFIKSAMKPCSHFSTAIIILLSLFFIPSSKALQGRTEDKVSDSQDSDRVLELPGQPQNLLISQYSGHITVNIERGRALFYWFFEAETQPSKKPLLLWLNGGPGCSSIGYGAVVELGPLRIKRHGAGLEFNKYAWNKEANLLFLESPVGVGFSYSNSSSDFSRLEDGFVAEDAYNFLVNWMRRFPQYQSHDFYIAGESYAGHYVPQLAEVIYEHNKDPKSFPHINLKGFMVGNPETDNYYDSKGLLEYAWSHSVISDQAYATVNKACNWSDINEIDIYNIYAPMCIAVENSSLNDDYKLNFQDKMNFRKRIRIPSGYDPCFSNYVEKYFNRADVKRSLHVTRKANLKWKVCNGDTDGRVPVIGSRYCVESLGLPLLSNWQIWYHNKQVGGRFVEYQGLTMVTIRGAGHLVPLNKPKEALMLLKSFLLGQSLPIQR
ncbi:serine carboxypeptidase-like 26 isoform X2 [Dendrobium catenatum]|uniref:serine carboxypeptidase-like 26 isoform X2 n=1 Tax=Dendrobium catenatum TaxID=906689 RepID=UPI0010A07AEB|nr:serine carboxypeptidase-like 26 isoform X2 [Dendrobium catenatum]